MPPHRLIAQLQADGFKVATPAAVAPAKIYEKMLVDAADEGTF